jgi:hypothetical protein
LQAVPGENAFWLGLEADYDDGATHWIEANLDSRAADGTDRRFMAWRLNRATNAGSAWAFVADDPHLGFRIENEMNAATFQFVPGSSTRNVQFALAGGRGELFQLGYDGSADAPDGMTFGPSARGDGSGVNVWNVQGHPSNTQVGGGSRMGFGNAAGTFGIASTESPPTANPTGGGVLYVRGGALMYRGPSGTVTRLAPG